MGLGPASGLCCGYTMTRAILSDAIALVRGACFSTTREDTIVLCGQPPPPPPPPAHPISSALTSFFASLLGDRFYTTDYTRTLFLSLQAISPT